MAAGVLALFYTTVLLFSIRFTVSDACQVNEGCNKRISSIGGVDECSAHVRREEKTAIDIAMQDFCYFTGHKLGNFSLATFEAFHFLENQKCALKWQQATLVGEINDGKKKAQISLPTTGIHLILPEKELSVIMMYQDGYVSNNSTFSIIVIKCSEVIEIFEGRNSYSSTLDNITFQSAILQHSRVQLDYSAFPAFSSLIDRNINPKGVLISIWFEKAKQTGACMQITAAGNTSPFYCPDSSKVTYMQGVLGFMAYEISNVKFGRFNTSLLARPAFRQFLEMSHNKKYMAGFSYNVFKAAVKVFILPDELVCIMTPCHGSYDDLVSKMNLKLLDAVADYEAILADRRFEEFTRPYYEAGETHGWLFMKTFNQGLWFIVAAMIIFTFLVVLFVECQNNNGNRGPHGRQIGSLLSISFTTLLHAHREPPNNSLYRFLLVLWLILILVVTATFTASLTSMITKKSEFESFATDIDVPLRTNSVVGCDGSSFVIQYLVKVLGFQPENIINMDSIDDYAKALSNGDIKAAFIATSHAKSFLAKYKGFRVAGPAYKLGSFHAIFVINVSKGFPFVFPHVKKYFNAQRRGLGWRISKPEEYYNSMRRKRPKYSDRFVSVSSVRTKPLIKIAVPMRSTLNFVEESHDQNNITRFSIDVFEAAAKALSYKLVYEMIPFHGSHEDMLKEVSLKTFDAAIGDLLIRAEAYQLVEFSQPYFGAEVDMIVTTKKNKAELTVLLVPFTRGMWLIMVAMIILTGFVVWFIERQHDKESDHPSSRGIGTILWLSFSRIYYGPSDQFPRNNLSHLVLAPWFFLMLIFISAFTASLTSIITTNSQTELSKIDVNMLKRTGSVVTSDGSFIVTQYLVKVLKFRPENVRSISSFDEYAKALSSGHVKAAFILKPNAKAFLAKYCSGFTIAGPTYKLGGFGFVFQKGSTLGLDMSQAILRLSESGELQLLEEEMLTYTNCSTSTPDANAIQSLGPGPFLGLFVISGGASAIALLITVIRLLRPWWDCVTDIQAALMGRQLWMWVLTRFTQDQATSELQLAGRISCPQRND